MKVTAGELSKAVQAELDAYNAEVDEKVRKVIKSVASDTKKQIVRSSPKRTQRYSKGWKVGRISRTALAILRCAICEILYVEDVPASAAINEAVELDKGYDEPETVAFVNGVLGGFMKGEFPARDESACE